jgi:hypothetical protein
MAHEVGDAFEHALGLKDKRRKCNLYSPDQWMIMAVVTEDADFRKIHANPVHDWCQSRIDAPSRRQDLLTVAEK